MIVLDAPHPLVGDVLAAEIEREAGAPVHVLYEPWSEQVRVVPALPPADLDDEVVAQVVAAHGGVG